MSQVRFGLRIPERGDEVGNLRRVDAPVRAGASASGPSETLEGRLADEVDAARSEGKVGAREAHERRLAGDSRPRAGRRKTLKRRNPRRASSLPFGQTPSCR
jgi:hypothetical protein